MLGRSDLRVWIASAFLLTQAGVYYTLSAKQVIPTIRPWNQFPTEIKEWKTVTDEPLESDVLAALKPDDYLNRNYVRGNQGINLFVAYFDSRRDGRAPHSPQWCLPGAGWTALSSRVVNIPVQNEVSPVPVEEYIVEKGDQRSVVIYWYHQGERETPSEIVAQFYAIPDMLAHRRTDTSLVRVFAPAGGDFDTAKGAALSFARDVYPLVRRQIR
jgi:EpsI family protein